MVILGNDVILGRSQPEPSGWASEDRGRTLLRAVLRVSNLDASVKFLATHFNFWLQAALDAPGAAQQRALVTVGDVETFGLELVEEQGAGPVHVGDWFSHFTLVVDDTAEVLEGLKAAGYGHLIVDPRAAVIPVRSESPVGGQSTQDVVAVVKDLDGYRWRVMEMRRGGKPPPLCSLALRVTDLERSAQWAVDVLGLVINQAYEAAKQPPVYKTALLGYGPELGAVQLELRQTEESLLETRGNGFVWLVVGTSSLTKTQAALEEAAQPCEIQEIPAVSAPEEVEQCLATRMVPDGWEVCFTVAATADLD